MTILVTRKWFLLMWLCAGTDAAEHRKKKTSALLLILTFQQHGRRAAENVEQIPGNLNR